MKTFTELRNNPLIEEATPTGHHEDFHEWKGRTREMGAKRFYRERNVEMAKDTTGRVVGKWDHDDKYGHTFGESIIAEADHTDYADWKEKTKALGGVTTHFRAKTKSEFSKTKDGTVVGKWDHNTKTGQSFPPHPNKIAEDSVIEGKGKKYAGKTATGQKAHVIDTTPTISAGNKKTLRSYRTRGK
jgi:hypothetical protein